MFHILFIILKIIGIILLCILALLLFLLAIILFVPVRYKVRASKYEKIHANMKASWLLRILYIRVHYASEEETYYYLVRLFGIPIIDSRRTKTVKKAKKTKIKKTTIKKAKIKKTRLTKTTSVKTNPIEGKVDNTITSNVIDDETNIEENNSQNYNIQQNQETLDKEFNTKGQQKVDDQEINFISKFVNKIKCFFNKIKKFFHSIRERIKKLKQSILNIRKKFTNIKYKIHLIKEFLTDDKNKEGLRCTLTSVKKVLKHILPYKIKGEVRIGLEDPCNTGYLLGALSIIYPIYEDRLKILPDFQEEVLEGKVVAKGRIRAFTLLKIGIKLILDKRFKMLLKNVRELKEEL